MATFSPPFKGSELDNIYKKVMKGILIEIKVNFSLFLKFIHKN